LKRFFILFFLAYQYFFKHLGELALSIFFMGLLYLGLLYLKANNYLSLNEIDMASVSTSDKTPGPLFELGYSIFMYYLVLYPIYCLRYCYASFICFEKADYNILKTLYHYTKYILCNFYKLFIPLMLKIVTLILATAMPYLMVIIVAILLPKTGVDKLAIKNITNIINITAIVMSVFLFVYFYIRTSLVEFGILVSNLSFFKAYEFSNMAISTFFFHIYFVMIANVCIIYLAIKSVAMYFGISYSALVTNFITLLPNMTNLDILIVAISSLFIIASAMASDISCGALYKKYAFNNDENSADLFWKTKV